MRTVAIANLVVVSAACLLQTSPAARAEERQDIIAKPLLVLSGADSRVDKTAYHRITSADEFTKLWLAHLGKTSEDASCDRAPTLAVDFERCMVIAIFQCERGYSRGLNIVSVIEGKDSLTLRFENLLFQVAVLPGAVAPEIPVTPAYAFVVVPKSTKPVIVEEGRRDLKDQPAEWRERSRLNGDEARDSR